MLARADRHGGTGVALALVYVVACCGAACKSSRAPEPAPEPRPGSAPPGSTPEARSGSSLREARAGSATPGAAPSIIDVHVHLTGAENIDSLLAAFDRNRIERAVIMASPHLAHLADRTALREYRPANELVLDAARRHKDRFIPFITVDLGTTTVAEVETWLERGACGVKLYQGHRGFHERPLDDPSHLPLFSYLARRNVPVLLHVNTVRFRDELVRLVRHVKGLRLVCPHLCGSRTDLDRLEGILRDLPGLLVDTSHGPGLPGIDGFTNLDAEGPRLRRMIEREPERFLFGTDLVSNLDTGDHGAAWDLQIGANKGLLSESQFRFWQRSPPGTPGRIRAYRGMDLPDPVLARVLAENARDWLKPCLDQSASKQQ